jgi:hypothetical protein
MGAPIAAETGRLYLDAQAPIRRSVACSVRGLVEARSEANCAHKRRLPAHNDGAGPKVGPPEDAGNHRPTTSEDVRATVRAPADVDAQPRVTATDATGPGGWGIAARRVCIHGQAALRRTGRVMASATTVA